MPNENVRYQLMNGVKSIDLPQYPDSAWTFATGAPEKEDTELYSKVAPVFRAVNLDANVKAGVPWALVTKGGKDYDTSEDWQNNCGFMPNPSELFKQMFMSLSFMNAAYLFMETRPRLLRYLVPTTITPVQNLAFPYNLTGFERAVGASKKTYSVADNVIRYLWRLDHTTELLPSTNTEFKALSAAAGILFYADFFVENYYKGGGVKATVVAVKGQLGPDQAKDAEKAWTKFLKFLGGGGQRAKVVNADFIDVKTIGDGVDGIAKNDTFREQCQKIAMAKGMPLSMLLSDYDNYSTAQVYDTAWFRDDIFPFMKWFASEMNEQVWSPLGLKMEYRPEQTDQGTQDEVDRTAAFAAFAKAFADYPDSATFLAAASMFGFEMSDDMLNAVNAYYAEKNKPAPVVAPALPVPVEPIPPVEDAAIVEPVKSFIPNPDQMAEINTWKALAFRKHKRGDGLYFAWEAKSLPAEIVDDIRSKLGWAKDHDDIKAAFDLTGAVQVAQSDGAEMRELAAALNEATAAMKAAR